MINEKDILTAACGIDENGINKAMVMVENSILSFDKPPVTIDEIILDNPVVNIFKSQAFTVIDLTFENPADYEFIHLAEILKVFCSVINSTDTHRGEVPAICITVCPKAFNGRYYAVGLHAMYTLQPSETGKTIDTIRFIVQNDYFKVYEFDTDSIDEEEVCLEAEAEISSGNYE